MEFDADMDSRNFSEYLETRFIEMGFSIRDKRTMHDYDVFQGALNDKRHTDYKDSTGATGYEQKSADYKQFFPSGPQNPGEGGNP